MLENTIKFEDIVNNTIYKIDFIDNAVERKIIELYKLYKKIDFESINSIVNFVENKSLIWRNTYQKVFTITPNVIVKALCEDVYKFVLTELGYCLYRLHKVLNKG